MTRSTTRPLGLLLAGAGVLVLAVVIALTTTGGGTNSGERFDLAAYDDPVVEGEPLPELVDPATDPAVGSPAPSIVGESIEGGETVAVEPASEGPMVLLFLAHWCPHCQREVPVVQDLVAAGGVPDGVGLAAVATAIDPNQPNYPPDLWLEGEEWNVPTVVDTDGSIAEAYGLSGFPYWVVIDADGEVAARFTGALGAERLEELLRSLAVSA